MGRDNKPGGELPMVDITLDSEAIEEIKMYIRRIEKAIEVFKELLKLDS